MSLASINRSADVVDRREAERVSYRVGEHKTMFGIRLKVELDCSGMKDPLFCGA
jgi:hypothetical protein